MQVLASVAPAADVNSTDLADASDRALDSGDQLPEIGGELVR